MTVEPKTFNTLAIKRLSGRIGAEIRNLELTDHLDEPTLADLRAALIRHKVIFIRDQTHLGDAGQEAFAKQLGELLRIPRSRSCRAPAIYSASIPISASPPIPSTPI